MKKSVSLCLLFCLVTQKIHASCPGSLSYVLNSGLSPGSVSDKELNKFLSEYLLLVQNTAKKIKKQIGNVHSIEADDLESVGLYALAQVFSKTVESERQQILSSIPYIVRNAMIDTLRQKGSGAFLGVGRVMFRRLMNTRKLAFDFKNEFGVSPTDFDLQYFVVLGRWPAPTDYLKPKIFKESQFKNQIVPLSEIAPWIHGPSDVSLESNGYLGSEWMHLIEVRDELEAMLI
jgi:hypothetical protein